jgi:HEAT repeat protein
MKSPRWRGALFGAPASLILLGLPVLSPASAQVAQGAPSAGSSAAGASIVVPAGSGQQALAVRAGPQGITARVCAGGACSAEGAARVQVPAEALPLLGKARATAVALADGKQVVRIEAPGARDPEAWVMLIAAPLAGKPSEPVVLWSGFTGAAKGEHGEGRTQVVLEEKLAKGSRLLVGEQREDVSICGRPTLVSAREVDPATMSLARGAAVQNISAADRAKAVKLGAVRVEPARALNATRLLKATAASSAVEKKFATLTDGDPETAWSENKAGAGRGEFVTMSSAVDVGITSLEIALRPETDEIAAPRTLLFATPDRLFEVTIPDDAGRKAGGLYEVKLYEEVRTACLAVVLEDAHAPRSAKSPRVTIAEVAARTTLSDLDPPALAGALAGGGDRSKAAAALLARIGQPGTQAAIDAYPKLDDEGKLLALHVIEASPCSAHVGFFVERLRSPAPFERVKEVARAPASLNPETEHALDRIRRCGRTAAPALAELLTTGPDRTKILAAAELALIAPAEAVPALLDAMPAASEPTRRELRKALANAAKSSRSKATLAEAVTLDRFRARPEIVQIDLLRAIGPSLGVIEGSAQAFAALAVPGASFRTRYLLQAPAAELARSGDAPALAYLRASLQKDPDPPVRARAAEVSARVPALLPDLIAAINDPEVRVREAAIGALGRAMTEGTKPGPTLAPALARRLSGDPWTFIRAGAASALGSLPASPEADKALAGALADLSFDVRGRALDALGAHRAIAYADPIRERVADPEEHIEVRARAILALAAMCDKSSLDDFTKYAMRAARPLDERDRRLGSAAVAALGMLHPPDLSARLAPLLSKAAPVGAREMARAAVAAEPACR